MTASTYLFPLTFAQRRLWFLEQLEPGSTSYSISWPMRLKGPLDAAALERSIDAILRRHEILTTTFSVEDGEPVQVVGGETAFTLPLRDAASEEEARRLVYEESRHPFDLEKGPLLRACLLRITAEDHVLLLATHHIVFDGWSRRILVRELAELYHAFRQGKPSPLKDLRLQYADYAVWQRKHLQGAVLEKQIAYWKRQLADAPAALTLPADRPRPAIQTPAGGSVSLTLSTALVTQLIAFAREREATLFMVLLAGFQALLSRYSGELDIVVGTPIAGRSRSEIEDLIGLFANTLVLRTNLSGEPTVAEAVSRVKEAALAAYAHQDAPFEKLVEELQPERSTSYNAIFQVLFALQSGAGRTFELTDLEVTPLSGADSSSKFDLSLFLTESPENLHARMEYSTDLFDAATIERMLGHYENLLRGMAERPEARLSELELLTGAEREQVLEGWNPAASVYPRDLCLHELFERQVERSPGAVACVFDGQQLTYAELNAQANRIAHYLKGFGVGPGQRVGIYLERSLGMMAGLLGIQKTGAAYVPLDPAYPAERIRLTLEDAQAPVLLTQESLLSSLPEHTAATVVCLDRDGERIGQQANANPVSGARAADLVYVIFTSGSTGRPKGVQVPHRAVVNLLTCMAQELAMGPDDVFPALASFAFDMCIPELYLALVTGGRVALATRGLAGDGEGLAAFLRRHGATVVHATPTTWNLLLEAGYTGQGLKRAIGAEALPHDLCRRLLQADRSLLNFYGPTETTVWSAMHRFSDPEETVAIGRPLANTRIYILDRNGKPAPAGVPGEIYIAGEGVACGYLNRPELTAEKFLADPFGLQPEAKMYRTGDLGRYLADGRIEFCGRADDQVKVRGYRIELGEIETVLGSHPAVRECVVIAREDVPGDKRLVGYVTPAAGHLVNASGLRAWVKGSLPDYMVPAAIVELESFPLTPNGKLNRKNLPAPEYRRSDSQQEFIASRTPTEELIAGVWAEVLKLDRVGVEDNFFELGGHSLLGTQVVSRIRQTFQVDLPLRTLFEAPTVAGLAGRVDLLKRGLGRGRQGVEGPALIRRERTGPLPLSFAQQRLWFMDQLQPLNAFYNVPQVVRLAGELQVDVLEASLKEVVRRHEILRTRFETIEGKPAQVIEKSGSIGLNVVDVSGFDQRERKERVLELTAQAIREPFNLATAPLLRASLIKVDEAEYILVLNTHHIISDQWSLGVLTKEVSVFYEAFLEGKPSPLPELPVQYPDYALWQREHLTGPLLQEQITYWKKHLDGAPPVLEFPTDRPRPPIESFRGSNEMAVLPIDLLARLKELSRREGVTLFMTLLGSFAALLSRYSGQEDIIIGSPIAGRNRVETEKLIGFFANTLVLRTALGGDPTGREILGRVKEVALGAYAHQDLPFERLVEELQPERSLSYTPLVQVFFVLQNAPREALQLKGLMLQPMPASKKTARGALFLSVTEQAGRLHARMEYSTDLFDAATIERMLGHYENLLRGMAERPEARLSELELLTAAEREQVLVEWNATSREYPKDLCLHQLFERQAVLTPTRVAVVAGGRSLTYGELNGRANQVAHNLRQSGAGPNVLIGIRMPRTVDMLAGLLGILKSGSAYVPLDPNFPKERIAYILEDSAVRLVLTEENWARFDTQPAHNPVTGAKPNHLAYVLHTSGSTGKPKGVQITHRNVVNFLASMQREPGLAADDVLLAVTTLSFDIAGLELYLPLAVGAKVVIASREEASDGNQLLRLMRKYEPSVLQATPVTWRMLLEAGWAGSPKLKVLCGGEALPAELAAQLLPRCGELWNMYGPTETTIWSSVCRIESPPEGIAPLGKPIANTTMYVLDTHMQLQPAGVPGELYIGGDGVAAGYLNRPDLTQEKFLADPFVPGGRIYRTGDLAKMLPDGNLHYLGRADFQVKVRGFRIELEEVETVLARHPAVQECVVIAREDRLIGYVIATPASTIQPSELRAWLGERLPEYMVPAGFVTLDRFPLTSNGKVDRKALPALNFTNSSAERHFTAPGTPTEKLIADIWCDALKLDRIGVHENFFELGGHSLLAVRVFALMEKATRTKLPLHVLFRSPTIGQIAPLLEQDTRPSGETSIRPCRTEGSKPPIYAAHGIGGTVLTFRRLASYLEPDQPVYCLEAFGSDRSWTCLEELAALYVKDLLAFQPQGPYHLIGSSFGGMVIFEMARQLGDGGHEVGFLGLLDSGNMGRRNLLSQRQRASTKMQFFKHRTFMHVERLFTRKLSEWPRYLVGRVLAVGRLLHGAAWRLVYRFYKAPNKLPAALLNMKRVYQAAGLNYVPKKYAGKITLFLAQDELRENPKKTKLGWAGWAEGGVDVIDIPGTHNTMDQELLAAEMTKCLAEYAREPQSVRYQTASL